MSFSFDLNKNKNHIREYDVCENCIHCCPFADNNVYCTVLDRKIKINDVFCDNFRKPNGEKRIVVVNAPYINKIIIPGYNHLYVFNGFSCIANQTKLTDFELFKEILDDKDKLVEAMKKQHGVEKPMFRFVFFAEKVNGEWQPIYRRTTDYSVDDINRQLEQLHRDFD